VLQELTDCCKRTITKTKVFLCRTANWVVSQHNDESQHLPLFIPSQSYNLWLDLSFSTSYGI